MKRNVRLWLALFLAFAVLVQYSFSPQIITAYGEENAASETQQAVEEESVTETEPAVETEPAAEEPQEATEEGDQKEENAEEPKQEEEKADVEDEAKDEEEDEDVEYPPAKFSRTVGDMTVNISAPDGALPEGAKVKVQSVRTGEIKEAVEELVDTGRVVKAVDITFYNKEGKEIEPKKDVSVSFASDKFGSLKKPEVVHINDDGDAEKVAGAKVNNNRATFSSDEFSVYAVIETVIPILTITFMNGEDEIATMYVKKGDTAEEIEKIIFDPGAGDIPEGEVFKGWTQDEEYTTTSTIKTIKKVREDAKTMADGLTANASITYYAAIYKQYKVTYKDGAGISLGTDVAEAPTRMAEASYTVNMGYTTDDTHNFEGWIVSEGTDNIKNYPEGAESETIEGQTIYYYPNTSVITLTGNVVFSVDAPEGHWLVFNENGKGATYNAPKFVKAEEVTSEEGLLEMVRKGYSFGGWYKDEACTAGNEFTFGGQLENSTTIYAKWIANTTAGYTVIFWTQNLKRNGYEVADSYVSANDAGTVGQFIPYIVEENGDEDYVSGFGSYGHYTGFCLTEASKNQEVTITPEGDAVLNLYYDRITYNFKFYLYRNGTTNNRYDYANNSGNGSTLDSLVTWHSNQTQHPSVTGYDIQSETVNGRTYYYFVMQAYYGEDISQKWPTYDKITGANGREAVSYVMMVGTKLKPNPTNQGSGTVKGIITVMDENILGATNDKNGNFVMVRFPDNYYNWRYHIWFETAEGEDYSGKTTREYNGKTYYEDTVLVVRSSNTGVDNQNEPKYTGFDFMEKRGQNWNNSNYWTTGNNPTLYHLNFVYNRQQYKISYFDGNYVDGNGNTIQNRSSHLLHESDEIGQGEAISEDDINYKPTLPDGEKGYVFEGWYIDEGCTVECTWDKMPVGGIQVYAKWRQIQYRVFLRPNADHDNTLDWGSSGQAMNFRISYGGKVSVPTGTRTGYEFLGWYLDEAFTSAFPSATVLNESTVRSSYDKEEDLTDTMNKWGEIEEPSFNADVSRDWITKKLDLYAKWSEIIVGADGISVVYDAKEGSNAPTDTALYKDNSNVSAGAASTPPENKLFDCWVVQKWNGTEFVDTNVEVLPGETFAALQSNARITLRGTETVVDPEDLDPTKNYTYTIQVRAKYKDTEEVNPTHIYWYSNYGGDNDGKGTLLHSDTTAGDDHHQLRINEPVTIYTLNEGESIPARTGYTFKGWTKTKGGTSADFLEWDGEKYTSVVDGTKYTVTQVAADERDYDDMYAVWAPDLRIKITGNTATKVYNGSEQSVEGYKVEYQVGDSTVWTETAPDGVTVDLAEGKQAKASGTSVNTDPGYPMNLDNDSFTITISEDYEYSFNKASDLEVIDGWLKIINAAVNITITAASDEWDYDGTAHQNTAVTVTSGDLLTGDTLVAEATGSVTNVADTEEGNNPIKTGYKIMHGTEDVTDNYVITTVDGTLTIKPAEVTITAASEDFTYDGKTHSNNEYTVEGLVGSDKITATITGSITFPSESPVTNTVDSYEFTAGTPGNYSVKKVNGQLTMTTATKEITITAASDEWDYDGEAHSNKAVTVTSGTLFEGDELVAEATGSVTNVADTSTGNNPIKTGYKIMHGTEDVTANYAITTEDGTLTIKPAAVTVTAKSENFTYDGTAHSNSGYDVSGLVGSDAISAVVTGSITFPRESPVTNMVASYEFTTGTAGNYSVTTADGELTMKKAEVKITITAASQEWTYDGDSHENKVVTVTSGELLSGDELVATATGSVTNVADTATGNNPIAEGYKIMHGTEDVTENYDITAIDGTLTINPKAVTITAEDYAFVYDGAAHSWPAYGVSGLVGSDNITATITGSITYPNESPVTNTVASYEFTTGTPGNYSVTTVNGELTMTNAQAEITIAAASQEWDYDGEAHSNKAVTVTGGTLFDGDTLVAEATGSVTNVADTADGNNPIKAGYKIMHGTEDVTANYAITAVDGTLTIKPAAVTVTAKSENFTYDGTAHSNSGYDVSGLVGSDAISAVVTGSITFPSESPVTNELTSYEFTAGTAGNYTVTTANGQLTMTNAQAEITITAASDEWDYDGEAHSNKAVTVTSGTLFDGDTLVAEATGSVTNVADTSTGNNPIKTGYKIMHGTEDVTANYDITAVDGTLTINPAGVTLTANSYTTTYDGDPHKVEGFKCSVEGLEFEGVSATKEETNAGEYGVEITGATVNETTDSTGNYVVTEIKDGKLNINPATLTITVNPQEYTYNGEPQGEGDPAYDDPDIIAKKVDVKGLVGDDIVTSIVLDGAETDADVYPERIEASAAQIGPDGEATGNYDIKYVAGTLTINPKEITVTTGTDNKTYDGTPLTDSEVSIKGLVESEASGVTIKATGTITDVGSTENTYEITWGEVNENNYKITEELGTLTVEQAEVTVTITGNHNTNTYNSTLFTTSGYQVKISDPLYTEDDFEFSGTAEASRTDVGTTDMGLTEDQFENKNENFKVTFEVTDGYQEVTPLDVTVTIIGENNSTTYDGEEHSVSGYDAKSDNTLFDVNEDLTFSGTAEASRTDVGKTDMGLTEEQFGSKTDNFNVTFEITDGYQEITKGTMSLDAEGFEGPYDAEEHFASATPSVTENTKVEYSTDGGQTWSEEAPSVTDVDEVEVMIRATNPNYEPVETTVKLIITPAEVTVTAKNSNKEVGAPDPEFEATVSGVIDDFEIEYKVTRPGAGTDEEVGFYPGAIVPDGEEYQGNYKVTYVNGDFEITDTKKLTVSANGYKGVYDGKSHEASAKASITEGTTIEYSVDGGQNWTTEPPSIKNVGDRDVLVRATNPDYGTAEATCTLKVTPKPVVIKTGSATKVYDGKALKNKKATITGLVKGESVDLKATGARTAVGQNANTYSIKWTDADKKNYTVTEKLGQLKVTPAPPAPGPGPGPAPVPGPTVATVTPVPQAPVVIDEPEPPTTIIDEPTPQAPVAVWALINLLCAIATALLSLIMLIRYFGKRREEDEETGEETEIKRKGGWRISSLIPAIGAIIAFILTEDMSNPMVMVDKWTLLMVIILAIQVGVAIMAKKKEDDEDDDEYAEA